MIINPALAYLTTSQNPDGGWGFYKADDSNVYMTAVVSATLQRSPQMTTIATAISNATNYLFAHQNTDGGFGSSPSTIHETALAYAALAAVSANELSLGNAVNYLSAAQSTNGSWNDDPYSTALALKALYLSENRPSPPPPPPAGGKITGTMVDASTNQRLSGVAVVLESNNLINTTSDASGNFTLNDIPAGSQTVSFALEGYKGSSATPNVVVNATLNLGNIELLSSYSTGTIAGTVADPSGKPLAGVAIAVTGAWSGNTMTGTDGSFTFTYVTPGEVTISASKAGYQAVTGSGTVYARTILTFQPRLGTGPGTETTGTLVGRVVSNTFGFDLPIDHLPGEQGVTVTLGNITAEPDPNNRGIFEIQGLAPGTYQVTVGMNGLFGKTFRAVILPGVTTDLGTIRLEMSISKMTLTGIVTDASTGVPIRGAAVTVVGTLLAGRTDFSGRYAIADIVHPSEITVRAAATGYTGKSFIVGTQPFTQTMNIALTPRPTTGEVTGTEVDVTVQTDKPAYTKSDTIGLTVNLWNKVGQDYATTLRLKVTDPAGNTAYETTQPLNLAADASIVQKLNFGLPLSAPGGTYKIVAEASDTNGMLLGVGTESFGVATSQITVTPTFPAVLSTGENEVSFKLANIGNLTVADGVLDVTLKDPDGLVISTALHDFSLGLGESRTITSTISVPALKFGTYTLSYAKSDETIAGAAIELALPNTIAALALFDNNSHRIRATAELTLTVKNSGLFNLDPAGAGLLVKVSVPDAGYEETKILVPAPAVGNAAGSALLYRFVLPETLTAGLHQTAITFTLPSGSSFVQTAQLAVLESSLALSPLQTAFTAGGVISPAIVNDGGVDTSVQYTLSLYDAKAALIAETTDVATALAGASLVLGLPIPVGAVDGSYSIVISYKDLKTGKESIIPNPINIAGVKGTLLVQTDKQDYLKTETITALSSIANSGTLLQDGNLHLQVTTTAGTQGQKTWTSQADFQQGVRNGVDTYGVNDWIIPDDDFNLVSIDSTRWYTNGNVTIRSGKAFIDSTVNQASLTSKWKLEGDFDIQVDYSSNNSVSVQGPQLQVSTESFYATVHNNSYTGDTGDIVVDGIQYINNNSIYRNSGKLRLTRVGDTITTYYWNGSAWAEITHATSTRLSAPCGVVMKVWRWQTVSTGASAEYDNFRMNSGRIKTENQTVDSVRLLPLSDNFDDGVLNEERWTQNFPENLGSVRITSTDINRSPGMYHRYSFTGDFSATSVYKNYAVTPPTARQGRFVMQANVGSNSAIYINRWSNDPSSGGEKLISLSKIGDSWLGSSALSYASDSGRFRLRRVGTKGFTDYWDGTQWLNQLTRSALPTDPASLLFYVFSQTNFPTVQVDMDSFVTNNAVYAGQGNIILRYDSGVDNTHWGKILHASSQPAGTSIKFRTRTADAEAALSNAIWSDYLTSSGSAVTSLAARWIEIEATLATTNTNVTPLLHDVTVTHESTPGQILWQTDVPADLAAGAVSEFTNIVGTLGVTGKLLLQGELTSSTGQTVASAEYPFYVEQGDMALLLVTDKKIYRLGETVTVTGEMKNRSSVTAAGLILRVMDPGAGEGTLYTETFDLPAQSSRSFTFTTTAGNDGIHALQAAVMQNNATLAEITEQYQTASPLVTATLTAPETVGNQPFAITVSLNNAGQVDASTSVQLTDEYGTVIGTEGVTIAAGETSLVQYSRQIANDTLFTAVMSGDLNQTLTHKVSYVALPSASTVSGKIVTDRVAYNPNEAVALTATVTAGSTRENLSALVTVTNSQGQGLYSATMDIPTLIQGQLKTISNYWNVGTNPAGTYAVTLQILDAGTVVAKATCGLVINSIANPTVLLKGKVALDKQSILTGEPIVVSYSMANVGNVDLSGIALTVQTVDRDGQVVYQTITDQATLNMGSTFSSSGQIDTQSYSAKDYLVVLRASIAGTEETLAGTYFRVEGAPSAPAIAAPANNSDVGTFTPALAVSNSADPNENRLTYEFEIYQDSGLTTLVTEGTAVEMAGITQWIAAVPLIENQTYYWRARAYDGHLFSPWMAPAAFRVNTVDDPPSAPQISSPANDTSVSVFSPALTVTNAADPDSTTLTYNFDLSLDRAFTQIVTSAIGIASGQTTTSWTIPATLEENGWYYWRAQADDLQNEGPWSAAASFLVNTANDPPSAPVIVAPANDSAVTSLSADIVVTNSTDPDSPILSYYFEADVSASFNSAELIRSDTVVEGQGATLWNLSGLRDNTRYHVRVKASDGMAESPWVAVQFFANTTNDPPSAPVLDNPSDGAGVTTFTPTLSVRNATDLDGDPLTYEFEVCSDAAMTNLIARADSITEAPQATTWELPLSLTENQTYYWSAKASDGSLLSDWMPAASFMVNTANDAPGAPQLSAPTDGMSLPTLNPTLTVVNAIDPDGDKLTYDFEVYNGGVLVTAISGVSEGGDGHTSITIGDVLADNSSYTWRAKAFDGERYGQWMNMATFSTHILNATIRAGINFEPDTLNKRSQGEWVKVEIELPQGYKASDVNLSSIRLEGVIPVEPRLMNIQTGATGDRLSVKFRRNDVISLLPVGEHISVQVTGDIGSTPFEGVDVIRVIDKVEK